MADTENTGGSGAIDGGSIVTSVTVSTAKAEQQYSKFIKQALKDAERISKINLETSFSGTAKQADEAASAQKSVTSAVKDSTAQTERMQHAATSAASSVFRIASAMGLVSSRTAGAVSNALSFVRNIQKANSEYAKVKTGTDGAAKSSAAFSQASASASASLASASASAEATAGSAGTAAASAGTAAAGMGSMAAAAGIAAVAVAAVAAPFVTLYVQMKHTESEFKVLESLAKNTSDVLAAVPASFRKITSAAETAYGKIADTVSGITNAGKSFADFAENGASLTEYINVADKTFGDSAGSIKEWAKTTEEQFGLVQLQAIKYSSTFGTLLKGYKFDTADITNYSKILTALAGEWASFRELSQEKAAGYLSSAIFGSNTRQMRNLGVDLGAAAMQEYMLQKGIKGTYQSLTQQDKAILKMSKTIEQSKDAIGDFEQTSRTWSNQMRLLKAQIEQIKTYLGQGFISAAGGALYVINQLLRKVEQVSYIFQQVMAMIFGTKSTSSAGGALSDAVTDAYDGVDDAVDSTAKKAAKKIRNAFIGIDDVTVLQTKDSSAETAAEKEAAKKAASSQIGGLLGNFDYDKMFGKFKPDPAVEAFLKKIKSHIGEIKELINEIKYGTDHMADGWNKLQDRLQPFKDSVKDLWDKFLKPLASFTGQGIIDFYDNFILPIAQFVLTDDNGVIKLNKAFAGLGERTDWSKLTQQFREMVDNLSGIAEGFFSFINNLIAGVVNRITLGGNKSIFKQISDGITDTENQIIDAVNATRSRLGLSLLPEGHDSKKTNPGISEKNAYNPDTKNKALTYAKNGSAAYRTAPLNGNTMYQTGTQQVQVQQKGADGKMHTSAVSQQTYHFGDIPGYTHNSQTGNQRQGDRDGLTAFDKGLYTAAADKPENTGYGNSYQQEDSIRSIVTILGKLGDAAAVLVNEVFKGFSASAFASAVMEYIVTGDKKAAAAAYFNSASKNVISTTVRERKNGSARTYTDAEYANAVMMNKGTEEYKKGTETRTIKEKEYSYIPFSKTFLELKGKYQQAKGMKDIALAAAGITGDSLNKSAGSGNDVSQALIDQINAGKANRLPMGLGEVLKRFAGGKASEEYGLEYYTAGPGLSNGDQKTGVKPFPWSKTAISGGGKSVSKKDGNSVWQKIPDAVSLTNRTEAAEMPAGSAKQTQKSYGTYKTIDKQTGEQKTKENMDAAWKVVSDAGSKAAASCSTFFTDAGQKISDGLSAAGKEIEGVPAKVSSALSSAVSAAENKCREIGSAVIGGITSAKDTAVSYLSGAFDTAKSTVITKITELGEIKDAAAAKLTEIKTDVVSRIQTWGAGIADTVGSIRSSVVSGIGRWRAGITEKMDEIRGGIEEKVKGWGSSIKNALNGIDIAGKLKDIVKRAFTAMLNAVIDVINTGTGALSKLPGVKIPQISRIKGFANGGTFEPHQPRIIQVGEGNHTEYVAQEEKMQHAFLSALAAAGITGRNQNGGAQSGGTQVINLTLDGRTVAQVVNDANRENSWRQAPAGT